jgi:hypothetical protein
MWSVEHTATSDASRDALWNLLSDPSRWSQWNPTIAESSMDGPFADGTTVALKTGRGRVSDVTLRDVLPGVGFTTVSRLPAAELRIEHELSDGPDGRSLATERAVLEGPLARIWSLLLGHQLTQDMTAATRALAKAPRAANG